jgi:Fic family protein
MMKVVITNEMLDLLLKIERNKVSVSSARLPLSLLAKLRKNTKKKTSFATNKIEGNPLSEEQADNAMEDSHKHGLSPEQEMRNVYLALTSLEARLEKKEPVSLKLIFDIQAMVMAGASKEKIGIRGEMPPGVLFAVYDSESGSPDYIPPEAKDVRPLLSSLIEYITNSSDHPIIKAAVAHYELVSIHPFEDGNGRTARLLCDYILDYYGYGFNRLGSLDEYFFYNLDEYYASLQMGLPALYYDGRNNPPHPEIWILYFLRMMDLCSSKVAELSLGSARSQISASLSHLSKRDKAFLGYLLKNDISSFRPIDLVKRIKKSNRTIAIYAASLVENGFLLPSLKKERITSYSLDSFALENKSEIIDELKK